MFALVLRRFELARSDDAMERTLALDTYNLQLKIGRLVNSN